MPSNRYTEIEHPEAYAAAIKRNIHGRANARRFEAWKAAHPHLFAWYDYHSGRVTEDGGVTYKEGPRHPLGTFPNFVRDSFDKWGAPSEKATAVLQRIFEERTANASKRAEERAAEAASAEAWKPGRQVVEGIIISIKEMPGFGPGYYAGSSYKMLVKRDDGSRIYLSLPSSLPGTNEELKGKRVRFSVAVEPKAEEPTFAFGKRPMKATLVEEAK